jgi:DNA-nicking Smr family endonuclease
MKVRSLADLVHVREALQRRAREAAEQAARERAARAAAERQRCLFANTVGPVTPLPHDGRALLPLAKPAPEPRQRELDEQAALMEAMSDEVDIETLLLTDDGLSFRRSGVGQDVVTRLRRGHWSIQAEIDLHGLRREEARDSLAAFVRGAALRGQRCLRVVHGKGHGSPGRQPVLKGKVQRWLGQSESVIAFAQASGPLGGAGALIVLLVGRQRVVRAAVGRQLPAGVAAAGSAGPAGGVDPVTPSGLEHLPWRSNQ